MKKNLITIVILTLFFLPNVVAQITSISALSSQFPLTPATYSKIELGVTLDPSVNSQVNSGSLNPYNPDEINLWAELYDANTMQLEKTIYGFYMVEYVTTPHGQAIIPESVQDYNWRLRFVVEEAKQYVLIAHVSVNNGPTITFPPQIQLTGQSSSSHGYLRFPKEHKYMQFTDGTPFFGIAETFPAFGAVESNKWDGSITQTFVYPNNVVKGLKAIMDEFSNFGGNFIKYNFAPASIDLEWSTPGNYASHQHRAQDFDKILDHIATRGVYVQLGLWAWEQFNLDPTRLDLNAPDNWQSHPYTNLSGVSSTDPLSLFVDYSGCSINYSALEYMKRKIRYTMARWGYNPSIASIELMIEMDNIGSPAIPYYSWDPPPCPPNRQYGDRVEEALAYLGNYVKTLNNRMLVTASTAIPIYGDDFYNTDACDYIDFHDYNSNYFNGGSQEAYFVEVLKDQYKKPLHSGECGSGANKQWYSSWHDVNGNDFDPATPFSNIAWSSAFSGAFTNAMHFLAYGYIHSEIYQAVAYQKLRPLAEFFAGEDLNSEKYVAIKNPTAGGTPNCAGIPSFRTPECLTSTQSAFPQTNADQYNPAIDNAINFSSEITTSDDNNIEVYALRSQRKVLGWVHNKTNYFYTLPHQTDPLGPYINEFIHPDINGNLPSPSWIQQQRYVVPLIDHNMTINGLNCAGEYQIDWYNTRGNGGILPQLTVTGLQPVNGSITVNIPSLLAASNSPDELPDYGFKITMTQNDGYTIAPEWKTEYVNEGTMKTDNASNFITSDNNRMYYRGADGKLHCYYYDEHCWETKEVSTSTTNDDPDLGTGMASNASNQIFYRNNIGKLEQVYEIMPNSIIPTWATYMHSSAPSVSANCNDIASKGTSVFYVSANNYITEVYWDGVNWQHIEVGWPPAVSLNNDAQTAFAIVPNDKKIFYRNTNGKLQQLYWAQVNGVYQWVSQTHSSSHSVANGSDIKITPDGQVVYESVNNYITILSFDQGTQQWSSQELSGIPKLSQGNRVITINRGNQIFYNNINGDLQEVYWGLHQGTNQWIGQTIFASSMSANSYVVINNPSDQLFYYDNSGDLNQVYFDHNTTSWTHYIHPDVHAASDYIYLDKYNKIFYTYSNILDRNMKVLWWDNPCTTNTPCTDAPYKPGRQAIVVETVSQENLIRATGKSTASQQPSDITKNTNVKERLFSVYPNPSTNGIFNISSDCQASIEVRDVNGKEIRNTYISKGINQIDLSGLANGIYVLQYTTDVTVKNIRLVIKQ